MTQTYLQIQKKIEKLQKTADALRQKEVGGVIARIKVAIEHYGLTARQLGLADGSAQVEAASKSRKAKPAAKAATGAKYSNGDGQSWSGRGPRPRWLREAIAGGKPLEAFLVASAAPAEALAPSRKAVSGVKAVKVAKAAKPKAIKRRPSTVLYRDGGGNSWTGRGPQPRWLKEALAAGKTLEELKG